MRPRSARRLQENCLYVLLFVLPISKAAIELVFPVWLVAWCAEHVKTRWRTSIWRQAGSRWVLVAVCAYVGVCAVSILVSDHAMLSVRGFVGKTLEYALFFIMAAELGRDRGVVARGVAVILASACVVGLDAVAQEIVGRDLFLGHALKSYGRMTGPYENPIDLATYLIVILPIAFGWLAQAPARRQWLGWALVVLLSGCLLRIGSRGAWLGFGGGFGLLVMGLKTFRKPLLAWSLGVAAVALAVQASGRLFGGVIAPDMGSGDRLFMWQSAWRMVQDRPILGHGVNTFMANYLHYWVGGERQPRYAHNCFLQVAAETGVLGLVTFVGLLSAMGWRWGRAFGWLREDPAARWTILGLSSGLLGFVIQSALDTNFYALRQATLFWTLAGLATGLAVSLAERRASSSSAVSL